MGFHALGLKFINQKTIGNRNRIKIEAKTATRTVGFVHLTIGLSQNLGLEMEIRPSQPQDPVVRAQ